MAISIRQLDRIPPRPPGPPVRPPARPSARATTPPQLRNVSPAPAPAPEPARQEKKQERYWWQPNWQDSAYNAQLAAVNRALADYETELGLQSERYGTDFLKGIRDLGYRPSKEFKPSVDIFSLPGMSETGASGASALSTLRSAIAPTIEKAVGTEPVPGTWDYEGEYDPYSAAARGTRTSRDEFAGRGTLRSSDFARAYDAFQRRMQDQLNAMQTGRTRYFEDAAIELAKERASAEERRQSARANAMARAAAQGEYRTR